MNSSGNRELAIQLSQRLALLLLTFKGVCRVRVHGGQVRED